MSWIAAAAMFSSSRSSLRVAGIELKHMLEHSSSQDPDEQELIMAMLKSWEAGKAEARAEAQANAVLAVLRVRGIAVSDTARDRIRGEKNLAQLERWLEKAVIASSVAEVIDGSDER